MTVSAYFMLLTVLTLGTEGVLWQSSGAGSVVRTARRGVCLWGVCSCQVPQGLLPQRGRRGAGRGLASLPEPMCVDDNKMHSYYISTTRFNY